MPIAPQRAAAEDTLSGWGGEGFDWNLALWNLAVGTRYPWCPGRGIRQRPPRAHSNITTRTDGTLSMRQMRVLQPHIKGGRGDLLDRHGGSGRSSGLLQQCGRGDGGGDDKQGEEDLDRSGEPLNGD